MQRNSALFPHTAGDSKDVYTKIVEQLAQHDSTLTPLLAKVGEVWNSEMGRSALEASVTTTMTKDDYTAMNVRSHPPRTTTTRDAFLHAFSGASHLPHAV